MNTSQIVSITGAILAVVVGLVGGFLGWITPIDAIALASVGLSLVGVHVGGSVAGSVRSGTFRR